MTDLLTDPPTHLPGRRRPAAAPDPVADFWEASSISTPSAAAFGLQLEAFEPADAAMPDPFLGGSGVVALRPVDDRFQRRLAARRSGRSFGSRLLSQRAVENVLASMGPTADGRRTVPEAGGLDAVHVYAVLRRVEGSFGGAIIRYDHRRHAVQRVAPVPGDDELRACFLLEGEVLPQALLVFVIDTGEPSRKYGARATRFALQQVGHAAQNAGLRVAHDGLEGHLVGGGLDREVLALLGVGQVSGVRYGGAYAFGR